MIARPRLISLKPEQEAAQREGQHGDEHAEHEVDHEPGDL